MARLSSLSEISLKVQLLSLKASIEESEAQTTAACQREHQAHRSRRRACLLANMAIAARRVGAAVAAVPKDAFDEVAARAEDAEHEQEALTVQLADLVALLDSATAETRCSFR